MTLGDCIQWSLILTLLIWAVCAEGKIAWLMNRREGDKCYQQHSEQALLNTVKGWLSAYKRKDDE